MLLHSRWWLEIRMARLEHPTIKKKSMNSSAKQKVKLRQGKL